MAQAPASTDATAPTPAPAAGRFHIFNAPVIEPKVVRWQELLAQGRKDDQEAQDLLVEIILLSTDMYSRMAQSEGFHLQVALEHLVSGAQSKTADWASKWQSSKGPLFSWLSTCAKNHFLAEAGRQRNYSQRYIASGDGMEKFVGAEDHGVLRSEAAAILSDQLAQITCRWSNAQIRFCISFCIVSISNHPGTKKKMVIRGAAYASGLSLELAKFLYSWSLFALRDAMMARMPLNYTQQDLMQLRNTFTFVPDLLNIITWKQMLSVIALMGGQRIKIPTLTQLQDAVDEQKAYNGFLQSDMTPVGVTQVARAHGLTPNGLSGVVATMSQELDEGNLGEHPLSV